MIPVAIVGCLLALRLWNAKPQPKRTAMVDGVLADGDGEVIGGPVEPGGAEGDVKTDDADKDDAES